MNFFAHQERARKKTFWLIVLFGFAVLGIVLGVHAVVVLATEGAWLFDPGVFAGVAIGVCGLVGAGSGVRMAMLSAGGAPVAESLGGRPVNPGTRDPMERRLLNVVEEMAIASGVPAPQVYVLDNEESINAFAAGHKPTNAVIGVTRGTMNLLSRDELQGVVAHEFSHLLNGDTRLNTRLIGLLFGIMLLALAGRLLLSSSRYVRVSSGSSDSKGGAAGAIAAILLVGVGIYLVGSVGIFFASLIRSAVSRQREFLADASAVQFTRNSEGISGALKKIGALALGSRVSSPSASEASHMFFANGMERAFMQMFATHPPLAKRIAAIEPTFDGDFASATAELERVERSPEAMVQEEIRARQGVERGGPLGDAMRTIGAGAIGLAGSMPRAGAPRSAEAVPDSAGEVTLPHMVYASGAHTAFPPALAEAAHELFGACAAVLALIVSKDAAVREEQLEQIGERMGVPFVLEVARLHAEAARMPMELRLPLVDTLMPTLAGLSQAQARVFVEVLQETVEHDGAIDLFEFCLQHIVARRVGTGRERQRTIGRLDAVLPQAAVVISALAALDAGDAGAADAFQAGFASLGSSRKARLLPADLRTLGHVAAALDQLAMAAPEVQRRILLACARTVFHDREVSVAEAELLRAISENMDCPMPPFLEGQQQSEDDGHARDRAE